MNVLYIYGNGFDINQGLKTSYPDFYGYLSLQEMSNPLMNKLIKEISTNVGLWSDMEEALGLMFTPGIESREDLAEFYYNLTDHLQKYLKTQQEAFTPSDKQKTKFIKDFTSFGSGVVDRDKGRLGKFRQSLKQIGNTLDVISFNYTNTLERLLSTGKNNNVIKKYFGAGIPPLHKIVHVNGILDKTIFVGVNDESQIANERIRDVAGVRDLLIKSQSDNACGKTTYKTGQNLIEKANLIIIYGVSLGETDKNWWNLIGSQMKSRNDVAVIYYAYEPNKITPTQMQMLAEMEREYTNKLHQKFGTNDEVEDRYFFVFNSSIYRE